MGCASSKPTFSEVSPLPPTQFTGPRPPPTQFQTPPREGARTLNAQQNWREKRAELPQLWNSCIKPEVWGGEFQDEHYDLKKPIGHGGGIQESLASHGSVSVPLLKKAPTTREQARQWKVKTTGVVHELDIHV